ncbi:hypothetical protein HDU87_001880 [Geranomyces variabilis]|uniref:Mediator of RNA polymerase II transcription subunit 11 n=1 Tax=Geranomyces variabilis TaxID=109894 RepID=A0AAD5XSH9_9FUNG|nr:hypothetical protein HDU87_001880 [Geranomyces variabilis]
MDVSLELDLDAPTPPPSSEARLPSPPPPPKPAVAVAAQARAENQRILNMLLTVDQRIVRLLNAAAVTVTHLASSIAEDPHAPPPASTGGDEAENFSTSYAEYLQTLNDVQGELRLAFRSMSKSGILSAAGRGVPYRASLAGDEKDLELAAKRVALVLACVERGVKDVQAAGAEETSGLLAADDADAMDLDLEF